MQNSRLVILGAGGHATSALNVALSAGYKVTHFVDPGLKGQKLLGTDIVGDPSEIAQAGALQVFVAIGDNDARYAICGALSAKYPGVSYPTLIHASAVISSFASLAAGTIVMPGAVVGPNTVIGKFCIVNTRSSIDHDGSMGDFSSLAPGVTAGGRVRIGSRAAICIGAIIKHDLVIGEDCVVGAGSFVNRDLPSNCVAYGTPARVVRPRTRGDRYL